MSNTKPPTPQGISALLRKAGYERGYRVKRSPHDSDAVLVNWWADSSSLDDERAKHDQTLQRYADVINEAGYKAEVRLDRLNRPFNVIVYGKEG
jgi:hypothetical protein